MDNNSNQTPQSDNSQHTDIDARIAAEHYNTGQYAMYDYDESLFDRITSAVAANKLLLLPIIAVPIILVGSLIGISTSNSNKKAGQDTVNLLQEQGVGDYGSDIQSINQVGDDTSDTSNVSETTSNNTGTTNINTATNTTPTTSVGNSSSRTTTPTPTGSTAPTLINPTTPPDDAPIDVCRNLDGNQTDVPDGYVRSTVGNCAKDLCLNLNGNQDTIPSGHVRDSAGKCTRRILPDLCINIRGNQTTVPAGYTRSSIGVCNLISKAKYPADILGKNWKITLPVGGAREIKPPSFYTFSNTKPGYFFLNSSKNGVVFRAWHGGDTTSGSKNPRSELRERYGNNPEGYWTAGRGTHTMEVVGQVNRLTRVKPHVVIAQVHDDQDDTSVWRVEGDMGKGSTGRERLWLTKGDNTHGCLVDGNFQLGKKYTLKYVIVNGKYNYYYNGKRVACSYSNGAKSYFKAGNYLQSNPDTAKGESKSQYSEVVIYSVKVSHK